MYKGRIDLKDLPDEYLQNLEDKSYELGEKIAMLLDAMKDRQVSFHCIRKAYMMILSSSAYTMRIPPDVFEQILKGDASEALRMYVELRDENDRIDS